MKRKRSILAGCLTALLAGSLMSYGQGRIIASEADARAALIFRLAGFTQWPEDESTALPGEAAAPLVLAIESGDGVQKSLITILKGKTIHGRPIEVIPIQRHTRLPEVVHVLYTSRAHTWKRLKQELLQKPVLCIGAYPSFLKGGGDILISREKNRMAFSVELDNLRAKDMDLESGALARAKTVYLKTTP